VTSWQPLIDANALKQSITGPLSVLECEALSTEAARASGSDALEVGHYKGLSTAVLLQSLPRGMTLWSVDHHKGDHWCPHTRPSEFEGNVRPYVNGVALGPIFKPFSEALGSVPDELKFVFYDADHTTEACEQFWGCVSIKLAANCVLVFDDADWDGMARLRELAAVDGFEVVPGDPFRRGPMDKATPDTFTLQVMARGAIS
jgi:predicted O-methyltransferase YrrM